MINKKEFPRYFLIETDIFIKVDKDGDEVFGVTLFGAPYPPMKALCEGQEITKEEYEQHDFHRYDVVPDDK
jgi:hypothetical protein